MQKTGRVLQYGLTQPASARRNGAQTITSYPWCNVRYVCCPRRLLSMPRGHAHSRQVWSTSTLRGLPQMIDICNAVSCHASSAVRTMQGHTWRCKRRLLCKPRPSMRLLWLKARSASVRCMRAGQPRRMSLGDTAPDPAILILCTAQAVLLRCDSTHVLR